MALPPRDRAGQTLEIRDLSIAFSTPRGHARVVDNVSLSIGAGEIVGVIGESGKRQDADRFGGARYVASRRAHRVRAHPTGGRVLARYDRARASRHARRPRGLHSPRRSARPQSDIARRRPGRGAAGVTSRDALEYRKTESSRASCGCSSPRSWEAGGRIPASVFRRHAAACNDRHGLVP